MYTYAFLRELSVPLDLPEGMAGDLELIQVHRLMALVEPDLAFAELEENDERLIRSVLIHDRIIQMVYHQTTVLPLRFGTQFLSRQRLIDHLESHQQTYLEQLDRLQGKAEYLLKLIPIPFSEAALDSTLKGRDYFLAKKQVYQLQEAHHQQQQQELQQIIETIAQQFPWVMAEADQDTQRIYVLSDRQIEPLREWLTQRQTQWGYWQVMLSEALPPYHFV